MGFMLHVGEFFCSESGDFLRFTTGIMHSLGIKLSTGPVENEWCLWINLLQSYYLPSSEHIFVLLI